MAKAGRRHPAKISANTLSTLCKYFTQFLASGDQHLIQELVDFHPQGVNPRSLVVSTSLFSTLVTEEALLTLPLFRHYLLFTHYTEEKVRSLPSGPSQAAFLDTTAISALMKKPDLLLAVEKSLSEARDKYLPILEALSSATQARLDLAVLADLIMRCVFAKPWPEDHQNLLAKICVGKFSAEKIKTLSVLWASWIEKKYPEKHFAHDAGLAKAEILEDKEEVDLEGLTILKRHPSDPLHDLVPKFKRGDEVTVVRRMSWVVPRAGQKEYRKDVLEGTEAVVEGWVDAEHRKLLIKAILNIPGSGGPREITHEVFPRNVQLTTEYIEKKKQDSGTQEVDKQEEPAKKANHPKVPDWVLQGIDSSQIKEEKQWTKCLADYDKLIQNYYLRSRLGVCLETLYDAVPGYTEKDLGVFHRQNSAGAWKCELWTKRAFAPQELVFAPLSSQLKETHLTFAANCPVGVPKHGPGAHPDGCSLALDGRLRNSLAKQDLVDSAEHKGSLFWLVQRSSDSSQANMVFESVSWEHKVTITMPLKKRKHSVDWASKDLPTVPVLINKKAVKAHERLVVFLAPPKKEESKDK